MSTLLCTYILVMGFAAITMDDYVLMVSAKVFYVGDDLGWREPDANNSAFYGLWAAKNSFKVGDSVCAFPELNFCFEYKNDSVLVVEKWEYYHCATGKPVFEFDNGRSVVQLDRPGPFYFIGGTSSRCKNGQRLLVDVISPAAPSPHHSSGVAVLANNGSVSIALFVAFSAIVVCVPCYV